MLIRTHKTMQAASGKPAGEAYCAPAVGSHVQPRFTSILASANEWTLDRGTRPG